MTPNFKDFHLDFSFQGTRYNLDLVEGKKSAHSVKINGTNYKVLGVSNEETLDKVCKILKSVSLDEIASSADLSQKLATRPGISVPSEKKTHEIGIDILNPEAVFSSQSDQKTSAWTDRDKRLLPERKNSVAQKYWEMGVLKGEKDHSGLKGFLANTSSNPEFIEKSFDEAIKEKNFKLFVSLFDHLTRNQVVSINGYENLNAVDFGKTTTEHRTITQADLKQVTHYMKEVGFSGVISLSDGKTSHTVRSEKFQEVQDSNIPFSMHSVGKVLTGILATLMMEKGIVYPDKAILTKEILNSPIQLEPSVLKALPPTLQKQLTKKTMHQVMLHQGGFADYLPLYEAAIEKDLLKGKEPLNISNPEDFLKYADTEIYELGPEEDHYSNLGILLIGLSIQYHYNKDILAKIQKTEKRIEYLKNQRDHAGSGPAGREKKSNLNTQIQTAEQGFEQLKLSYKPYNKILEEYVLTPSGISDFSIQKPKNGRFNEEEAPFAGYICGSPGGGYWATSKDLQNFGDWVNKRCASDLNFLKLVEEYGGEFYSKEDRQIDHAGSIESATAHLSTFIDNGFTIAVLSDQGQMAASLMSGAIAEHLLEA